ncbi:MAG: carbohydrate kinase [Meiothermus sp.]
MSPQLVVFGDALIDLPTSGNLEFRGFVSGSSLIVATAASRLGVPTALATRLGGDFFAEAILEYVQNNGIDLSLLERGPESTTLAFVLNEGGKTRYAFRNENAADLLYAGERTFPASAKAIHFGSIALLFEPGASRFLEQVRAQRGSCLVHFDPNVRPTLIPDRERYLEQFAGWLELAHWVKLSKEDLGFLCPQQDEADVAKEWLGRGPSVVVVTDGEEGARLYRAGQEVLRVKPPKVPVVDTIGAGDTFSGATLVGLLERDLLTPQALHSAPDSVLLEVLTLAARAAAFNCTRPVCDPPTKAELEAWQVK